MHARRALLGSVVVVGLVGLGGVASADPRNGVRFPLTCAGDTFVVTINGNGQFVPAHDVSGTATYVPHAFGEITGEVRDTTGALVDGFDYPPSTQGSGKQPNDVACSYHIHVVGDGSDPGLPAGYTFDVLGSVTGQVEAG